MTVSMGMLIFAGLAYALEKDEPGTMFYTLPQVSHVSRVTCHVSRQALYWAIITMTSTGYGDVAPLTAAGKFVGSLCAICGVLCITLPIPIIVANFNRCQGNQCPCNMRVRRRVQVLREVHHPRGDRGAAQCPDQPVGRDQEEH